MDQFYKIKNEVIDRLTLDSLYIYLEIMRNSNFMQEYYFTYETLFQTRKDCPKQVNKSLKVLESAEIIEKAKVKKGLYYISKEPIAGNFTILYENDYNKIMESNYQNKAKLLAHYVVLSSTISMKNFTGYAAWSTLAKQEGTSVQTIIHMNHQLEELGMIEVHHRYKKTSAYKLPFYKI